MEVLGSDVDSDTVEALEQPALIEVFLGSAQADRLTAEALTLGQALNSGADQMSGLLISRAIHLHATDRPVEAVAYFREAARLADQTGNSMLLGSALLNMADVLASADPVAAAEAAGRAVELLRQVGERHTLAFASSNLAQALLMLGDWDTAGDVLDQALDSGGVGEIEYVACAQGWLAALRGDLPAARAALASFRICVPARIPRIRRRCTSWKASPPPPVARPGTRCVMPARSWRRPGPRDRRACPLGLAAGRPRRRRTR